MKQNADKARALSEVELEKQLKDGAEQMFRLRFQLSMGQADGLKKLRQLRKERARILTLQREKELEKKAPAVVAPTPAKVTAKPVAKKAKAVKSAVAEKPAVAVVAAEAKPTKPAVKKAAASKKIASGKTAPAKTAAKE